MGWHSFLIRLLLNSTLKYCFRAKTNSLFYLEFPSNAYYKKAKKARKSRGIEVLSDKENLDIILEENHFSRNERDESLNSIHAGRSESDLGDECETNDENRFLNRRNVGTSIDAEYCQNSASGDSSAEINRLSIELNSRLSRELNEIMSSVITQMQRAFSNAICSQILPQIQTALSSRSDHLTQGRWNVLSDRPEVNSERFSDEKYRENSRSKPIHDRLNDESINTCAYDMMTGDNESPIDAPEFLSGRMPSRSHLHRSHDALNPLLERQFQHKKGPFRPSNKTPSTG